MVVPGTLEFRVRQHDPSEPPSRPLRGIMKKSIVELMKKANMLAVFTRYLYGIKITSPAIFQASSFRFPHLCCRMVAKTGQDFTHSKRQFGNGRNDPICF